MFIAVSVLRGHSVTPGGVILDSYFFSFVIKYLNYEIYMFNLNNNGILKKIPQIMYDIHACTLVSLMGE